MKTRLTALLITIAAIALLSACSAGTHSDLEVSASSDTAFSFSESKSTESSSNPESTSVSVMTEETADVHSDAEESDTSIQASAASENVGSSATQGQAQSKPSSTAQPQAETSPEQKPQPTQEPSPKPTQQPSYDIGYWVSYAQGYAQSKGLNLDSSATECWDNPISAGANCTSTESNIVSRINRYAKDEDITDVWIWAESTGNGNYDIYIGYA